MKRRCKDSKYIGCYTLKDYKLSFRTGNWSGGTLEGGVADIERKKDGTVQRFTKGQKVTWKKGDVVVQGPRTFRFSDPIQQKHLRTNQIQNLYNL